MTTQEIRAHFQFQYCTTGANAGKMACKPIDEEGKKILERMKRGEFKQEIETIKAEEKAKSEAEDTEKQKAKEAADKAAKERRAKIDAIEGLRELRAAYEAIIQYRIEFNKMMDDEFNDGAFPPKKPDVDLNDLKKRYARADAYLKAEDYYVAEHYVKSGAGDKAMRRIEDGEDYIRVIIDMEAEWHSYCMEHMWD